MSDAMTIDVFACKGVFIGHKTSYGGEEWLAIGNLCIRLPEPGLARAMAEAAERFREAGGAAHKEGGR